MHPTHLLAAAALCLLPSCLTTNAAGERELDVEATHIALFVATEELRIVAPFADPELEVTLLGLAVLAEVLDGVLVAQIEGAEGGMSIWSAADLALKAAPQVADILLAVPPDATPEQLAEISARQQKLRLAVAAVRSSLVLIHALAPRDPGS